MHKGAQSAVARTEELRAGTYPKPNDDVAQRGGRYPGAARAFLSRYHLEVSGFDPPGAPFDPCGIICNNHIKYYLNLLDCLS